MLKIRVLRNNNSHKLYLESLNTFQIITSADKLDKMIKHVIE